jgi:hypothetical protein
LWKNYLVAAGVEKYSAFRNRGFPPKPVHGRWIKGMIGGFFLMIPQNLKQRTSSAPTTYREQIKTCRRNPKFLTKIIFVI